jgi:hypothetical protein
MSLEIIPLNEPRGLAGLAPKLPALFLPDEKTARCFFGFFTANIRNKHAAGLLQGGRVVLPTGARTGRCSFLAKLEGASG